MKLKMAPNSLFAILLRSPWWVSFTLALLVAAVARLALPERFATVGMLSGLPFFVIAAMAAARQWRAPSAAQSERTLRWLQTLNAAEFCAALEAAWQRQGHAATRLQGGGADIELLDKGRRVLVACRRWKATRTGVEPLRELHAVQRRLDADGSLYVGGGEISDKARSFAAEVNMRLMDRDELVRLMCAGGDRRSARAEPGGA